MATWPARLSLQQGSERLRQLVALHRAVLGNPQLLEEPLVDLPLHEVRGAAVLDVALGSHDQGLLKHVAYFRQMLAGQLDLSLRSPHGSRQSSHLILQDIERYRFGVMRLHESRALSAQLLQRAIGCLRLTMRGDGLAGHLGLDAEPDAVDGLDRQLKSSIQLDDAVLDALHPDGPPHAADVLVMPLRAQEVVVGAAASTNAAAEHQPTSTATAEDAAAQVVRVHPVLLSGVSMDAQDVLDVEPDLRSHQGFVLAVVGRPLEADNAHVVRVAQHVQQ